MQSPHPLLLCSQHPSAPHTCPHRCAHVCPHVQQEAQGPLTSLGMSKMTLWWWHDAKHTRKQAAFRSVSPQRLCYGLMCNRSTAGDLTDLLGLYHPLLFIRALLRRPSEPETKQEQPNPTVRLQRGHGKKGLLFPGLTRSKQKSSQQFQKMARTRTVSMPTSGMCWGDQSGVQDRCASDQVLSSRSHAAVSAVFAGVPPGSALAPCTPGMGWKMRATAAGLCGSGW